MSRPHSSTLVSTFEAPSHGEVNPAELGHGVVPVLAETRS